MSRHRARRLGVRAARVAAVAAVLIPGLIAGAADRAAAQSSPQMSADILAVQVRKQGFTCTNPKDVMHDAARSTPGHSMWRLTCKNATYMVHLVPKMSARVEQVE